MALTPLRWVAALFAACLVASIAVMDTHPIQQRYLRGYAPRYARTAEEKLEQRRNELTGLARAQATKLRLGQIVDSLGKISMKAATAPIRVFIDSTIPAAAKGPLDTLTAQSTRDVRDSGRMGLDVFVVYDTVSRIHGSSVGIYGPAVDYVLPRHASDRCSVILRVGNNPKMDWIITKVFRTEQAQQQLLGPCAYYRTFGMPGEKIDRWLRAGGWAFAGDGSWTTAAAPVERGRGFWPPFYPRFQTPLFDMSVDGSRCAAAQEDTCERVVFGDVTKTRSPLRFLGNDVLRSPYPMLGQGRLAYYRNALGSRQPFLFADMVRSLGKERFGQFWSSSQSPAAAFQTASGETTTAWTSRWAASQYGPPPSRGPGLGTWAAIVSALLIAAGAVISHRVAAERQFA
jgi:hypothetical protein